MPSPPLIQRANLFPTRTALIDPDRTHCTYHELLDRSAAAAHTLLRAHAPFQGARVAFLVMPSVDYVATQWGIWRAGGIAVPLGTMYPTGELAHVISDSDPAVLVAQRDLVDRVSPIAHKLGIPLVLTDEMSHEGNQALPDVAPEDPAMIVYTSGSTGKPKGVVTTHANIASQITSLVTAWGWTADDRILLTLPLHHVHGIINVLGCSLWSGATCRMFTRFDPGNVWEAFGEGNLSLFMAVPTIYKRLIEHWLGLPAREQRTLTKAGRRFRLMVSGSAALPVSTLEMWRHVTGHTLLERYGMTEIGMALSNPLEGPRRAGCVGTPLPGVEVMLADEDDTPVPDGTPGEIYVRGPSVFREYWRRPAETQKAFVGDWFKTGDIAVVDDGSYRILGRRNVDIIKTGGYKISALEIEEVLRTHPGIRECAVVGLYDEEWGERVAVAMETTDVVDLADLREWARPRLAPYKLPSEALTVQQLPRNPMGKVIKTLVAQLFRETE